MFGFSTYKKCDGSSASIHTPAVSIMGLSGQSEVSESPPTLGPCKGIYAQGQGRNCLTQDSHREEKGIILPTILQTYL